LAQLRYGLSLVSGRRIRVADIEHVVADILATRAEFGGIGDLAAFRGTSMAAQDRRPIDDRRLRRLARAAYANTAYYRHHFDRAGLCPDDINLSTLEQVPVTRKEALRDLPEAFVDQRVRPWYRAETTGTTGAPTAVWFSRHEADLLSAMTAISFLIDFELGAGDVVQLNLSSRAYFGIHCLANAAALIGAAACSVGLVAPEVALARLADTTHIVGKQPRPTLLITYSSYLGLLVALGESLGYHAGDFGLRQIMCGGEILTDGLRRRAERLFGAKIVETYGMTETSPASGQICAAGHLHFHPEQGITEVLDLTGTRPAEPGELGVLTFTPVHPYRETTLLLRLFSGDVVRRLADDDLGCELAQLPATSRVLGKRQHMRDIAGRTVTPRDILELIEADPAAVLPSRWATEAAHDGMVLHVLGRDGELAERTHERGLALGLPLSRVVVHDELDTMPPTAPVRADLRELRFADTTEAHRLELVR
jgi:phenylacetate-coenzyme A ligase PaaK-like adenylate-forming protein